MTLLDLSCDSCSFRVYFYILNKRIQLTCEKVQSGECRFFLALLMSLTNFNAAFDSLVAVKKFPGRYFQGRLSLLPLGRPQWKAPLVTKRLSRLTQLIIVVSWITIQVHWTICYLLMKFNCPTIDAVVNFENFFSRVESFFYSRNVVHAQKPMFLHCTLKKGYQNLPVTMMNAPSTAC